MATNTEYTIVNVNDAIKNATEVKLILSVGGMLDLTIPNEYDYKTCKASSVHFLTCNARRLMDGRITLIFQEISGWETGAMYARVYYR